MHRKGERNCAHKHIRRGIAVDYLRPRSKNNTGEKYKYLQTYNEYSSPNYRTPGPRGILTFKLVRRNARESSCKAMNSGGMESMAVALILLRLLVRYFLLIFGCLETSFLH